MELLAQNLEGLDASGLAQLDAAAEDPASLIAALASLVGVSVTENAGKEVKLSLHPQKTWPQGETVRAAPVTPLKGQDGEAELPRQAIATSLMPVDAKPTQQQPAVPGDPRVDMRSAVMTALANVGPGAEGEPVPMQSALAEARPIANSTPDIARTGETWQPPASGFARNLAQQIRSAKFTDGQTRIALAPRGLGEIEIDMQPDEAGKLRIVLRAENPAVLQALRGDRDGLLLALTESGADVRDADLGFEDFSRRQGRQSDAVEAPLGGTADLGIEEPPAIAVRSPRIDGNGSLDMLT